jgi:hypothetical protein
MLKNDGKMLKKHGKMLKDDGKMMETWWTNDGNKMKKWWIHTILMHMSQLEDKSCYFCYTLFDVIWIDMILLMFVVVPTRDSTAYSCDLVSGRLWWSTCTVWVRLRHGFDHQADSQNQA